LVFVPGATSSFSCNASPDLASPVRRNRKESASLDSRVMVTSDDSAKVKV
jgi:hypothetical protein